MEKTVDSTQALRAASGISLLFLPKQRPNFEALRQAVANCQRQASLVAAEAPHGSSELIICGLMFQIEGLAPHAGLSVREPQDHYGLSEAIAWDALEGIRIYPGHHLSGGVMLQPVVQALLALVAELAVGLPVQAVHWHPADTAMEPQTFSRSVLAWLAGGVFPALGLTALSTMADGSVVSRGLVHFGGQEFTLLRTPEAERMKMAGYIADEIVRSGPLDRYTQWRFKGLTLNAEPAREAKHVLVWPDDASS